MKITWIKLAAAFAICGGFITSLSAADTLASWNFEGLGSTTVVSSTTFAANSTVSTGATASSLSITAPTANTFNATITEVMGSAFSGSSAWDSSAFWVATSTLNARSASTTALASGGDINNAFSLDFSMTVDAGQIMSLTSLSYDFIYTSSTSWTAPFTMLYTSFDGINYTAIEPENTDWRSIDNQGSGTGGRYYVSNLSFDLTGLSAGDGDELFFKIVLASGSTVASRGIAVDNIQLHGDISAIPEPSTYAIWGGILVLGFVAWRRRRRG